jgi:hypothetical protein
MPAVSKRAAAGTGAGRFNTAERAAAGGAARSVDTPGVRAWRCSRMAADATVRHLEAVLERKQELALAAQREARATEAAARAEVEALRTENEQLRRVGWRNCSRSRGVAIH